MIGIVDSGIDYTHPDLAANIWTNPGEIADNGIDDDGNGYVDDTRGWDFANDDNDPMDDNGHGTHVAGTVGAVGNNGIGIAGVCWNVRLMPLKFLGSNASGFMSDAIDCIAYAASFKTAGNKPMVKITNHSYNGSSGSKSLENALKNAGALSVVAAGNGGNSTKVYPAAYSLENVLTVAATDRSDVLASFSNFSSSWVDLAAPGVNILSTGRFHTVQFMSGTSMGPPMSPGRPDSSWRTTPP